MSFRLACRTLRVVLCVPFFIACSDDPKVDRVGGSGGESGSGGGGGQDADVDLAAECADVSFDAADPVFPCDVGAVIADKCQRCHNTEDVTDVCEANDSCLAGPFPLLSWEMTRGEYGNRPIFVRMESAIERDFMPFTRVTLTPPVEPLTADEKALLLGWLRECGPPDDGVSCD